MKLIIFGILLSAIWEVSQAGSLVIDNASPISFSGYDGLPATVTEPKNADFWSSHADTSAGIFTPAYLNTTGALLESGNTGATISPPVGAGLLSLRYSDNADPGHTFNNGSQRSLPLGFAIMKRRADKYGTFDYLLGFHESDGRDASYDGFVADAGFTNVAPVPEPRFYAMMLAGLGLIGFSVRRRNRETFD
jgi:PEP-CTERM motif